MVQLCGMSADNDDNGGRGTGWYPFDKLRVYELAVRFKEIAFQIIALSGVDDDDRKQLIRSAKSTVRNICEAAGEFRPREKARFYRMALRSATESGGTLRLIEDDIGAHRLFKEGHTVNFEVVAMLTTLSKHKGK